MQLVPYGNRVAVRRNDPESVTPGGIVLPDVAQARPYRGTVLAVGFGKILDDGSVHEVPVGVGDEILFTAYAGEEFTLDGLSKILILKADDIIAVFQS